MLARRLAALGAAIAGVVLLCGCGSPPAEFELNSVYILQKEKELGVELTPTQKQNLADVMGVLFGTPDDPHVPKLPDYDLSAILDEGKLELAAGPVKRDEFGTKSGLYREHCVHCHGVTGDGKGPTAAFLNPYPRDYRPGVYKFKSTPIGVKPTHRDLYRILENGVAGTAMPSFKLLTDDEIDSLVHYVRYLSIRGEVEQKLVELFVSDVDEDAKLLDPVKAKNKPEEFDEWKALVQESVTSVAQRWEQADTQVATVAAKPPQWDRDEAIREGRNLFYGEIANCVKCHGDSALGDGVVNDYDVWNKAISPDDPELLVDYLAAGALPPRYIKPRNLRMGVYRGGRRPIDIYWRIRYGIEGSPMPAASMRPAGAGPEVKGLTEEDLWRLVEYVRSLPYEELQEDPGAAPINQRERM